VFKFGRGELDGRRWHFRIADSARLKQLSWETVERVHLFHASKKVFEQGFKEVSPILQIVQI
jgi:hypothetical protein